MPAINPHLITAHPEFFFPDGNLVLIAGTLAFCLHRGIVNRWSPAFRSMLDALDTSPDQWTLEGCGVIVLDDDPVDVERFIRALYDGTVALECTATTFPLLASLLILSHKYSISHLHTPALTLLLAAYPLTLPDWDAREAYTFTTAARHDRLGVLRARHAPHPLAAVSIALQLGMPQLLVPAYLDLARLPVSEIISGYAVDPSSSSIECSIPTPSPTLHLPPSQTTAVLRGKETLQRFIADFIKASVETRAPAPHCLHVPVHANQANPEPELGAPPNPCSLAFARIAHDMLVMTAGVAGGVDSDPLFVLACAVEMIKEGEGADRVKDRESERAPVAAACPACTASFLQVVDVARQHLWTCLPKWFDLRRFFEDGFEAGWE